MHSKFINISNVLYNKGIKQVRDSDLSGAIISLSKSIAINKYNIDARNLLGVIYFEVGKIADALKHWITSTKLHPQDNLANEYLKKFEENYVKLEKQKDSLKMYNQALEYLKQKSEDLATIQLKRVLDLNPNFLDAKNMLCLCYILQKNYKKALSICDSVLSVDIYNEIAINYQRFLLTKVSKSPSTIKDNTPVQSSRKRGNSYYSPNINTSGKGILGNISGLVVFLYSAFIFVISFALIYILLMPSAVESNKKQLETLKTEYSTKTEQYEKEIEDKTKNLATATEENVKLKEQVEEFTVEKELTQKVNQIENAKKLSDEDKKEEAFLLLNQMDTTGLGADILTEFNELITELKPQVEKEKFDEGVKQYNSKAYDEAKILFEKSVTYVSDGSTIIDDNYYYLGRIAEINEDNVSAKEFYNMVLTQYPDSNQLGRVKTRLSNLE